MSHGQPDFGMYAKKTTVYAVSDMAELAARLGSIDTHDRRGDVIWLEDFESDIYKWAYDGAGTGNDVDISGQEAKHGGFSCKLTTGDAEDNYAYITHIHALPPLGRLGFEAAFTWATTLKTIRFNFQVYDGTNLYSCQIWYDGENDLLQYYDSAGDLQNIATNLSLFTATYMFHTIKYVVDFEEEEYVRVILNSTEYSLAGIPIRKTASATAPQVILYIYVFNLTAGNHSAYIDDVILTQNEP